MICGLWGEDKSGKSSVALTFPKPIQHFEFDLGGYDRAIWRFSEDRNKGLITTKPFVMPIQGAIDNVTVRQSKIITGVKELWYEFLVEYLRFLTSKEIATGIIDTGTLLWEIICTAYLQEKQEMQFNSEGNLLPGEKLRVSLLPIEYREPNIRMRGIIYQAKAHGKHLVLAHHARDEYKPMLNTKTGNIEDGRSGKRERSGFSSLGDSADLMLHTYTDNGKFFCEVDAPSVPSPLVGMVFGNPSYDGIMAAIKRIKGEL